MFHIACCVGCRRALLTADAVSSRTWRAAFWGGAEDAFVRFVVAGIGATLSTRSTG